MFEFAEPLNAIEGIADADFFSAVHMCGKEPAGNPMRFRVALGRLGYRLRMPLRSHPIALIRRPFLSKSVSRSIKDLF
jgi:hypothetical protein